MNEFILNIFNTLTGEWEEVAVEEAVYIAYRRTEWGIKNNNVSFYKHEIQISALIGKAETFNEFISDFDITETIVEKQILMEVLNLALSSLTDKEKHLIQVLFFDGKSERQYARETGIPQKTINNHKRAIILKLKKLLQI